MKITKRIKIRFEKRATTRVCLSRRASFFCPRCQSETEHLTVAQTAFALAVSEKSIFYLTENKRFHSIETADGRLLICAESAANSEPENILGGD